MVCVTVKRAPREEKFVRSLGKGLSGEVALVKLRDPEIFDEEGEEGSWHLATRKKIIEGLSQGPQEIGNALTFSDLSLLAIAQGKDQEVMLWQEFAVGEPLHEYLQDHKSLTPWEGVTLLITLLLMARRLRALLAAHTDLHTGNVIVRNVPFSSDDDPKKMNTRFQVIDFGLTCQGLTATSRALHAPRCLPLGQYTNDLLRSPYAYLALDGGALDLEEIRDQIMEHCQFEEELPLGQVEVELAHRNDLWSIGMLVTHSVLGEIFPFDELAFLRLPENHERAEFLRQHMPHSPLQWLNFFRKHGWPSDHSLTDAEQKHFLLIISQLLDSHDAWCVEEVDDLLLDLAEVPRFRDLMEQLEEEQQIREKSILCGQQQNARQFHRSKFFFVEPSSSSSSSSIRE